MFHPSLIDGALFIAAVSVVPIERGIQHLRARWAGNKDVHHELRVLRKRCEALESEVAGIGKAGIQSTHSASNLPDSLVDAPAVKETPRAAAEKDNPKDKGKDKEPAEKPSATPVKGGAGGSPPGGRTFPPSASSEQEPEPAPAPMPAYDPGYSRQMPFWMTMIGPGDSVKTNQMDNVGGLPEIYNMLGVQPGDRWNPWQIGPPATDHYEIHYHDSSLYPVEARCTICSWHTMQFDQDRAEAAVAQHLVKHWRRIVAEHMGRPFSQTEID